MKRKLSNAKRAPQSAVPPAAAAPAVSAERVKAFIRSRFNPIRSLTPELLAQHLDSFKTGYLKQAALIWQDIEDRDDTLKSVVPKRKKALARNGWEIVTVDDPDLATEAERHKAALENFWNNITVTDVLDQNEQGELSLLIRQMMDAVGKRYAVHEIVWKPGADFLTAEFRFVPLWFFENTTGRLRFLESEASLYGTEMEDGRWLITLGDGLMYACSIAYIYKQLSLKDWIIYNERHGMPGIHGKTDATKGSTEWDDMEEAIENFAADWAILTNRDASIDKVDLNAAGQIPYPPLVDRMSRAMAAIWRGADLSTISAAKSDAGQGASVQQSETEILEADDAALISETLSRQIDRRVIEYTFGAGVKPLAYIRIKTSARQNVEQDMKIDTFLRDSGAPLAVRATLERYGRSLPEEDEPLLSRAPVPAFPSFTSANARALPARAKWTGAPLHAARRELVANAVRQLAESTAADLKPLRDRIQHLLSIEDETFYQAALVNLRNDLPKLLGEINRNPASAGVLSDTIGVSLLNGFAAAAQQRDPA